MSRRFSVILLFSRLGLSVLFCLFCLFFSICFFCCCFCLGKPGPSANFSKQTPRPEEAGLQGEGPHGPDAAPAPEIASSKGGNRRQLHHGVSEIRVLFFLLWFFSLCCPVVPLFITFFEYGFPFKLNQQTKGALFFPMATGHLSSQHTHKKSTEPQQEPPLGIGRFLYSLAGKLGRLKCCLNQGCSPKRPDPARKVGSETSLAHVSLAGSQQGMSSYKPSPMVSLKKIPSGSFPTPGLVVIP